MADNTEKNEAVLDAVENAANNYTKFDKDFAERDAQNVKAVADDAHKEVKRQTAQNWADTYNNIVKEQEAKDLIDDGYLNNMPKSIIKMFRDGDLGDRSTPEGRKKARNTMGLAIVQTLANTLGNIGNSVAAVGGVNPGFQAEETIADKINKTNLEQGLENKWAKEKTSTQNALKLVDQMGVSAEEALSNITDLTSSAMMKSQFNRMDEQGKAYAIKVQQLVGEELGKLSNPEMLQYIQGAAATGTQPGQIAAILIAKYAPSMLKQFLEKNGIELPEGTTAEDLASAFAGVKDAVENKQEEVKKENSHVVSTPDGDVDVGIRASKKDFNTLNDEATKLEQQWYDGTISDEDYLKQYGAIYDEWQKHPVANRSSGIGSVGTFTPPEDYLKQMKSRREKYNQALKDRKPAKEAVAAAQKKVDEAKTRDEKAAAKEELKKAQAKLDEIQATIDEVLGYKK